MRKAIYCLLLTALTLCGLAWLAAGSQYNITYIGAGNSTSARRVPVAFGRAEFDVEVVAAKAALASAIALGSEASVSQQRLVLKQDLLRAQEKLLPAWARWKPYRAPAQPDGDDGSYKDWKTSSEDDSGDSLTWLNEFFHPSAFIGRKSRDPRNGGRNATVYYQDYDPLTGVPYDETTAASKAFFTTLRQSHTSNTTFARMSSLDSRPERQFYRQQGGPCRYSVPFFMEPLMPREEGAHFFISANANLLATSYPPCSYFCAEYSTPGSLWPGAYLFREDVDPSMADRTIPPLDPRWDPSDGLPREGYSGIWIDRYVYASASSDVGVATHGATPNSGEEDITDASRQVSVVVTFENIPAFGTVSESNFTGQIELFTNGTFIFRYRSLGPTASHNTAVDPTVDPRLVFYGPFAESPQFNAIPMMRVDRFNNTNLTSLAVVAARFDIASFGAHRSDAAAKAGRCSTPALQDSVIPPGRRAQLNVKSCSDYTNCSACIRPSCLWCAGIRSTLTNNGSISGGLCLPYSYADAYCPLPAQYSYNCIQSDNNMWGNTDTWDFYNIRVLSLPDDRSEMSQFRSISSEDISGVIARRMRFTHAGPTYITRSNGNPAGSIPALSTIKSNAKLYGPRYLRKQTSAEAITALRLGAEYVTGPISEPDCYPAADGYYGSTPLSPTRFRTRWAVPAVPVYAYPESNTRYYTAVLQAGVDGIAAFVGAYLYRQNIDTSAAMEVRVLNDNSLAVDEVHACTAGATVVAGRGWTNPTVHRNVNSISSYNERVGSYDVFYQLYSNGTVSIGVLSATAPLTKYFGRLADGTDPFNVWYLQESTPPASLVLRTASGSLATVGSPLYMSSAQVQSIDATALLRPGRIITFEPKTVCAACIKGACDRVAGVCRCLVGFTGARCDTCAEGYFYDTEEVTCRSCTLCNNGRCITSTHQCQCNSGYSGPSCECTNGAQSHYLSMDGKVICSTSSCPSAKGYCRCGVCTCQEGYSGPECFTEASDSGITTEMIYFAVGISLGAPALIIAAGCACYKFGASRPSSLEALRYRLLGPDSHRRWGPGLVVPEISPPISSAPRESWTMLKESGAIKETPNRSANGRSAIRHPPNVAEPDVYEPPCFHYDEGGVDFL